MKTCLAVVVAVALAACSREPQTNTASGATAASRNTVKGAGDDAVAAVLQSSGKAAVQLRFRLEGKPVVAEAVKLRLDFSAADPVAALQAVVQNDGFVVDPAQFSLMLAEPGKVVSHDVAVTPQRPGLAEILVRLKTADAESVETVYAIPLLVAASTAPAAIAR